MSKKFPEYKGFDPQTIANDVTEFWDNESIFQKSIDQRSDADEFVFFEGPPSANGLPGIHHVMARAIKDIFCRYKTQKGYQVKRKAGWDTHGLPIELGVEKELGINKEDIGKKISVDDYNKACKEAVMRYTDVWNDLTQKMGYWVDMDHPYVTYTSKYMESVWWLLSQIYNKNLIYKGYTIQPYSPKAGTGLSSHELNQPGTYQEVSDTTVVAQFKAIHDTLPKELQELDDHIYFLAWTTTPWTLPSNTALTVGKKIEYAVIKTYNQYTFKPITVVIAKELINQQFGKNYYQVESADELKVFEKGQKKIPFQPIKHIKGEKLVESRYEQLLDYALPANHPENAFRVIAGDFVTTDDGTGIVHTAPTFGADDAEVAKQVSPEIPPMLVKDEQDELVPLVDLKGKFRPEMKELAGKYVKNEYYEEGEAPEKSVDVEIAIRLKEENKAFKVEKYLHTYPNCWRTDKPILYYPLDSWFIKVTDYRERMVELNNEINWKPKSTGEGRFGNWLANANDWNLSRSRYWGIPLPIWRTEDGKQEKMIDSIATLKKEVQKSVDAGMMKENPLADFEEGNMDEANYEQVDLHKNYVDQLILVSDDGKPMKRESDLIDVWFDSGSMPYAQWHYPFEEPKSRMQADFIAEGVDQTRGWFYTLHAIATLVFDRPAYKNVVSNGLVLDKNGQKMSKRLGNAIDPFKTIEEYGPDVTRWYMISNANPWDNLKFDLAGLGEVKRKFFGTLYNTYSFFALYANIDGFAYQEADIKHEQRPEIDRWILSELNTLIKQVDHYYANYEPTKATRLLADFVLENLSNWYVRLSRRRFWKGDYKEDKISAYQTLFTCLKTVSQLMAPIAPFYGERLFKDLNIAIDANTSESVHLALFPTSDHEKVDDRLEDKMHKAQIISSLVLSLRKKEKIKVRQPLQKVLIPVLNKETKAEIQEVENLIKSEVNVKEIEFIDDASGLLIKDIKPNFKTLGPRFGKSMKQVVQQINQFGKEEISKLEQGQAIEVAVDEETQKITKDDVEILSQDIEGWKVASSNSLTVALDISITGELQNEGIARELVNRIQNFRKDSGFDVTDKIDIELEKHEVLEKAVNENLTYIKSETLTSSLIFAHQINDGVAVDFDNINTTIHIQKHK